MPDLPPVHNPRKTKHLTDLDRARRNQAKRVYRTNSPTWRRIRKWVLDREPLCRHCRKLGRITEATEVDHISGDTGDNSRQNLQPLCKPCHTRKTNAEDGAGWKPKQD